MATYTQTGSLVVNGTITGNQSVLAGGTPLDPAAILQANSTTQGFLPPRMTTTQRDAITAVAGLIIFNTTTDQLEFYNGVAWIDGSAGQAATIAVGTTTTGNPGTNASVTNSGTSSAAIFDFTIPRGNTGATGPAGSNGSDGAAATIAAGTTTTGAAGSSANVANVGTSSAAVFNFTIPRGDTGAAGNDGTAATIAAGTTTTGNAGTNASVANSGTSSAAIFDFTIPRGNTGATGAAGSDGAAATIAAGTTTTGAAGTNASVTNVGTSSAAIFDFTIPRGNTGATGATGPNSVTTATTTDLTGYLKGDGANVSASATIPNTDVTGLGTASTQNTTTFLQVANNLSDLNNASTARTNLGLGTLATQNGTFSGTSSGTNSGDVTLAGENYLSIASQVVTANAVNLSGTNATGTLAAGRFPALTGDVTTSAGSVATTIANDSVTYAKIQNVSATDKVLGRSSIGAGDVEEIACTAAGRALIDDADAAAQRTTLGLGTLATQSGTFSGTSSGTNTGDVTLAGENYLSIASQVVTANAVNLSGTNATGTLAAGRFPALSGDVTTSAGSLATTIGGNKVTAAKMAASATDVLFGRSTAGAGAGEEIACTAAGRALIDDADAAAQRTTLGLGSLATQSSLTTSTATNLTGYIKGNGSVLSASTTIPASDVTGLTSGTVTSVAVTVPSVLSVSGSPITSSGTIALSYSGTALPIANGGTASTSANAAFNALAPSQTSNSGKFLTTNATDTSWSGVGTVSRDVTQIGHGFVVGDVLNHQFGSSYAKAKADSAADAEVVGIVSAVVSTTVFTLLVDGYITGLSGLTGGTVYFLSPSTAGALTSTAPTTTGQISVPLLVAESSTTGYFHKYRGQVIGPSSNVPLPISEGGTGQVTSTAAFNALATVTDTGTTSAVSVGALTHNSSGLIGGNFGADLDFKLQDSTTASQLAGKIRAAWTLATHGSANSVVSFYAVNNNAVSTNPAIKIGSDGAGNPLIGFLGAATLQTVTASPDVGTMLTNLGFTSGTPTFASANLTGNTTNQFIILEDQKTQNTGGGTFTSGAWRTRTLNTEVVDTGNNCTLSSNQFTLTAGTYRIRAWSPAIQVGQHQSRLQNISDGTTTVTGKTCFTAATGNNDQNEAYLGGRFTIASSKTFEIQHQCQLTSTIGFGFPCNFTTEVYCHVEIEKEAT